MTSKSELPHVVILGGGFGGLSVCKYLNRTRCRITMIDRQNHHLFQPLLYQVATAGLSAPDIAKPIRSLFRKQKNLTVLMDEAVGVDAERKELLLRDKPPLSYDMLVMAVGARTNYFGNDRWEKFAPGLKTIDDARRIRHDLLMAFEHAEHAEDPAERQKLMRTIVVGGGATGVELAGAVAELAKRVLTRDFRNIDTTTAEILLLEVSPRVLGSFSESLSAAATTQLRELGVEVRVSQKILDVREGCVVLEGEEIEAGNVLWGAGVRGTVLSESLGVEMDGSKRIRVNPDCSVPGLENVYAIGDAATLKDAKGVQVPGVSPAAMQMGKYAALQIRRSLRGKESGRPFVYLDKGSMATVGRKRAVADIRGWETTGFLAWLLWLFIHLLFLVGFQKKHLVLVQWIYSYATYSRGSRLITGQDRNFKFAEREKHGAQMIGADLRPKDVHDLKPALAETP